MTEAPDLTQTTHPGGVVCLTLNRSPVNALSADGLLRFAARIKALEADDDVRAIVIASPFKVFSAGLNLKEAQHFDLAAQHDIVRGLNEGFLALFACAKPTVVAVEGAAIAGGLFYVLASDLRIASAKAQFGLAEVRVGADFPLGPMEIARATLSANDLRRLMLTGQPVSAEDARMSGMIDRIVAEGTALDAALAEAAQLGQIPPKTFASVKRQIRGDVIARIEAGIASGANAPEDGWFNAETIPAMRAMLGG